MVVPVGCLLKLLVSQTLMALVNMVDLFNIFGGRFARKVFSENSSKTSTYRLRLSNNENT